LENPAQLLPASSFFGKIATIRGSFTASYPAVGGNVASVIAPSDFSAQKDVTVRDVGLLGA
jgi:hypothetical protein